MASLFIRTYTFVDGTTAYGSQVESEISNITTVLNNLNTAVTTWGQVSVLHATSVPLIADCSSGSQDIADFKNNAVIKASIGSGGQLTLKPTTNQIVLGTTTTTTISATAPSVSRVLTIPDPGAAAEFVLSEANSTINGVKTFGSSPIVPVATTATQAPRFSQLKVIQVASLVTTTTAFSTTSATFQTTNLSGSITPSSASNRILIVAMGLVTIGSNADDAFISIFNGSTNLMAANGQGGPFCNGTGVTTVETNGCVMTIDSPASTSAQTYSVKIRNTAGVATAQFGRTGTQTMLLMEVV